MPTTFRCAFLVFALLVFGTTTECHGAHRDKLKDLVCAVELSDAALKAGTSRLVR